EIAELAAARLAPDANSGDIDDNLLITEDDGDVVKDALVSLPILGRRPAEQHQRTLAVLLALALLVLGAITFFVLSQADKISQQVAASGQALMQSQRLAKSVSQALVGSPAAFPEVRESSNVLATSTRGLKQGDSTLNIDALGNEFGPALDELLPRVDAAERNAGVVLGQQATLTQVGNALRAINRQS